MKAFSALLFATAIYAQTTSTPTVLLVSNSYNITSSTQYFDNRSAERRCSVFTYVVTSGTSSWQAQMEFSTNGPSGPWISFGSYGVVKYNSAFPIGWGYGYKPFVRINTTAGTTVSNFSCENTLFLSPSGTGTSVTGSLVVGNLVEATSATSVGDAGLAPPASTIVGISDAQQLTNKTFNISANTFKAGATHLTGVSGNGSNLVTTDSSSKPANTCAKYDGNGNLVSAGFACGNGGGAVVGPGSSTIGDAVGWGDTGGVLVTDLGHPAILTQVTAPVAISIPAMSAGTQIVSEYFTPTGTGSEIPTSSGSFTLNHCVVGDGANNIIDSGALCGNLSSSGALIQYHTAIFNGVGQVVDSGFPNLNITFGNGVNGAIPVITTATMPYQATTYLQASGTGSKLITSTIASEVVGNCAFWDTDVNVNESSQPCGNVYTSGGNIFGSGLNDFSGATVEFPTHSPDTTTGYVSYSGGTKTISVGQGSGNFAALTYFENGAGAPPGYCIEGGPSGSGNSLVSSTEPCGVIGAVNEETGTYDIVTADLGKTVVMNGANLTAFLPLAPPTARWFTQVLNINTTPLTLSSVSALINGLSADIPLQQFQSANCYTDGTNYFCAVSLAAGSGVSLPVLTVSTLPACGAALDGQLMSVSDSASSPAYNGTVAGGGSTKIPVFCNGSSWTNH